MMKHVFAAGALALALGLFGGTGAAAQQRDTTGMPLAKYCNTVPNLSVKRRDAIDTWVSLCTVWFQAHRDRPRPPPKDAKPAKPVKE
ncbi:MAG: hypothetical protein QGI63_10135 [Rhodospirillales bacterium]|nr:hypothetical protein [Rhodospirillales bacterium]MDP6774620.1 hypothetical protein [Rhodospirillales bacterium]|tara:strand:- start:157 stop:417 length:261 start_codon:yes stop_codon:yes gene_type:complete